ncbi:YihY/virulence factor BrkB family protein [Halegenticoccus tardaugens]|uniref:YihY/virulence factor BrkB family protein n=1 Tax=Halegenticoccus tardaugens TaxID=2071624 RepID=UPI00100A7874|nr:YihY/virulence factor BrkB family protein [Halegenticoccus tardaugens]
MLGSLADAAGVGRAVLAEFKAKNVTFMAGSIAYNAFVSLAPLIVLLVLVVSAFGSGELETRVIALTKQHLTPSVGGFVESALGGESGQAGASVAGLVVLVWGTLKIFRGLDTAFSDIFESEEENALTDQLRDGLVVLVALTIAIAALVAASAAFAAFDSLPFLGWLNPILLVVGLSVAFFPLYYVFPDVDLSPREVVPGVVVAATGWAVLQGLFQVYLEYTGQTSPSDVLSGIVVLLTWLYFSGLVLLFGAVVNAVLHGHATASDEAVAVGGNGDGRAELLEDARMNRDEGAAYLRRLREDLTGRYEGMRPTATDGTKGRRSMPEDSRLEVTERSYTENGREVQEVRLRWPAEPDE